jgi:hypothetical protein
MYGARLKMAAWFLLPIRDKFLARHLEIPDHAHLIIQEKPC